MTRTETLFGISMLLLGGVLLFESRNFTSLPGLPVSPALFPTLIGIGLLLVGAAALIRQLRLRQTGPHTLEMPAGARLAAPALLRIVGIIGCIVFFALFALDLGFIVTASIAVTTFLLIVGRPVRSAILLAVCASIICYLFFDQGLGAMLPTGPVELRMQGVLHA